MIWLFLTFVFVSCFSLATCLDPLMKALRPQSNGTSSVIGALVGESRHLFANQLFVEADVYFHSGYYPSIFDTAETNLDVNEGPEVVTNRAALANGRLHEEEGEGFLGGPGIGWIVLAGISTRPNTRIWPTKTCARSSPGSASPPTWTRIAFRPI